MHLGAAQRPVLAVAGARPGIAIPGTVCALSTLVWAAWSKGVNYHESATAPSVVGLPKQQRVSSGTPSTPSF